MKQNKKKRLNDFITSINELTERKQLDTWQYNDLLPKGKNVSNYSFESLKDYLIGRKEKSTYKAIEREVKRINEVNNAGELVDIKISIEWKHSQMWGANPTAECWYSYRKDGNMRSNYIKSGSIGGCGYDKESTAVAEVLNQINEVLKPLFLIKDANMTNDNSNHKLLGYGAGYGILPHIEGGVGTSCYNSIFEKIGFNFNKIASGKSYDVYTVTKIQ